MSFFNDNKKKFEEGAVMVALAVWVFVLIVTIAGILNTGDVFRSICAVVLAVPNVCAIVKVWKWAGEKYRKLVE